MESIILIGYSEHAYVVFDIFKSQNQKVIGYCDKEEVSFNPFSLAYFGKEFLPSGIEALKKNEWFIAIGNNQIRKKVFDSLISKGLHLPTNAIHKSAVIGSEVKLGQGIMIGANATINAFAEIGTGVICNTGCIIEHECKIDNFAHIAPGAVLAGNVKVGRSSFIGANAVVKQGIQIGKHVTVGAGTVVIKDVPDHVTIVGNPHRIIKS